MAGDKEKSETETIRTCCPCFSGPGCKRFIVAWMTCLGLMIVLAMRCELGIAIIRMTKLHKTKVPLAPIGNDTNGDEMYKVITRQDVHWSHEKVGFIESAFFIGYMLFSVPGGLLATVYPANRVLGIAVLVTCSLNLFVPAVVHTSSSFAAVFAIRIMQGVAEGCLYPAVHGIWRFWAPVKERSKLVTISFFGMALGPIVGFPFSGVVTKRLGWPSVFYIYGVTGMVWVVLWLLLVRDKPSNDPYISNGEREHIEMANAPVVVRISDIPWRKILTSFPVWGIVLANIGRNWTYQFSTSGLPEYFKDVFKESTQDIGFHMAFPYIFMAILTPLGGNLADCSINKRKLPIGFVRKLFNTIGFSICAACLVIVGFVPRIWMATMFLTIALGFMGIGLSGFGVNHLDIAPRYAAVLMGLSNGIGTFSGILSPVIAASITRHQKAFEWRMFFILSAIIHALTIIAYVLFGSGEEQPWSHPEGEEIKGDAAGDYGTMDMSEPATDTSELEHILPGSKQK